MRKSGNEQVPRFSNRHPHPDQITPRATRRAELKWSKTAFEEPGAGGHGYSTHDVITYASKARRHKEIYPYLRYGFVVGNAAQLGRKFFVHNTGFDFGAAIPVNGKLCGADVEVLMGIVERQLGVAEVLGKLQSGAAQVNAFSFEAKLPAAKSVGAS